MADETSEENGTDASVTDNAEDGRGEGAVAVDDGGEPRPHDGRNGRGRWRASPPRWATVESLAPAMGDGREPCCHGGR